MRIIVTLIFTLLVSTSTAQFPFDDSLKQKRIAIHLGHAQFLENNLHPKVFRGLNAGASYQHSIRKKNISEFSSGLNISMINTAYEEFPSALGILLQGGYKYLFPIAVNERLKYYAGPLAQFQYGTNAYFNWDESHLYYANFISGGIGNRIIFEMGKYKLEFNLDMPLLSGISRPQLNRQYKIDDMTFSGVMKNLASNPETALADRNFYVATGIDLYFKTKNETKRSIGLDFLYHRMVAMEGEPFKNMKQSLTYKYIF